MLWPFLRRGAVDVGGESREGERVPVIGRQLLDPPVVDDHARLRVIGAQQRGLGGHLYVFGSSADLHVQIDGDAVANTEDQANAFQVLEPGGLASQLVRSGDEIGKGVIALAVADGADHDIGVEVFGRNRQPLARPRLKHL